MNKTDGLFSSDPFAFSSENRRLFVESFREIAAQHYAGNTVFRYFWNKARLLPNDIIDEESLKRVPPLMVHVFKEWDLKSVPAAEIVLTLTSSGTTGQKSLMHLNALSLARVKKLAYRIHEALGMTSPEEVNYICFTYDPNVAKDLGTAFTDELLTSFTGRKAVYYALQWNDEKRDFIFNADGVVAALKKFAAEGAPVRLLGFPAFLYRILKEYDIKVNLGPQSWVQTGGGWKGFAQEEIPKGMFRKLVSDRLGLPVDHVRDMFGMVEHGIPYCDCAQGKLHVPNYARVFIRSPRDLKILDEGEVGLIHFICSYNNSYPSICLLTPARPRISKV